MASSRRGDTHEEPAEGAAPGDAQVVGGEALRGRTQSVQLAVKQTAAGEEQERMARNLPGDGQLVERLRIRDQRPPLRLQQQEERSGGEQRERAAPVEAHRGEAQDERQQVDTQRDDPQEGHAGDVEAQLVGDAHEQHDGAAG
jgi:hypothetical protein